MILLMLIRRYVRCVDVGRGLHLATLIILLKTRNLPPVSEVNVLRTSYMKQINEALPR